jgi:5'-phosphate synthase pdxT subunit
MSDAGSSAVGVLALQGDFEEHVHAFRRLGQGAREVRLPTDLESIDALVIPGGESTTIWRLLRRWELLDAIRHKAQDGMAVWGTCAGAILLANECDDPEIEGLHLMDIQVRRNAFGRQIDSFEADITVPALGEVPFHCVFIRAPAITGSGAHTQVWRASRTGASLPHSKARGWPPRSTLS